MIIHFELFHFVPAQEFSNLSEAMEILTAEAEAIIEMVGQQENTIQEAIRATEAAAEATRPVQAIAPATAEPSQTSERPTDAGGVLGSGSQQEPSSSSNNQNPSEASRAEGQSLTSSGMESNQTPDVAVNPVSEVNPTSDVTPASDVNLSVEDNPVPDVIEMTAAEVSQVAESSETGEIIPVSARSSTETPRTEQPMDVDQPGMCYILGS